MFSTQSRAQENPRKFSSAENIFETSRSQAESLREAIRRKNSENTVLFEAEIEDEERLSVVTQY